jgi:hypothetical protein
MYIGRKPEPSSWTYTFWMGEALVISMFTYNSLTLPKTVPIIAGLGLFGILAALWLRGKVWHYATVVGLELFMLILVAVAFPVMELVLEAVLNEKLRKVGDKVRHHHQEMQKYYEAKLNANTR